MLEQIFIFLYLIISCSSEILPMEKKSEFGDDVCGYLDSHHNNYYVRPCEKGKYCANPGVSLSNLLICRDIPNTEEGISTLDGSCSSDFECEFNLECIGSKCSLQCPNSDEYPYKSGITYSCKKKAPEGYCQNIEHTTDTNGNPVVTRKYGNPKEKSQICGIYTFHHEGSSIYSLKDIKYGYIGSVDDGEYVSTEYLCKSGFALPYYPNGNLADPSSTNGNSLFKRCVTPIAIDKNDIRSSSCVIYYKEKEGDSVVKKYNIDQLMTKPYTSLYNSYNYLCSKYNNDDIKISLENFKEYITTIKDNEREKCGDLDNNKYSCDNNELIEYWYFYQNHVHIHLY